MQICDVISLYDVIFVYDNERTRATNPLNTSRDVKMKLYRLKIC